MALTDVRAPKREKETDRGFSGVGNANLPDDENRQDDQSQISNDIGAFQIIPP